MPAPKAIFLDRDGTITKDKDYLRLPEEVEFFPGAIAALKRAADAGFLLIMVTNQSGVGRGYFTLADVENVHAHIAAELARAGVTLQKIYVAPEAPETPSRGRKPSPQFLFDARDEFGIDLSASYMIGDKLIDLQAGWNAGVRRSLLVRTGYGRKTEADPNNDLRQATLADDFAAAITWILAETAESPNL